MPKTLGELREKLALVRGLAPLIQLDVMDGKFVPNRSWPYHAGGNLSDDFLAMLDEEQEAMPFWEDFDFEADLMISSPDFETVQQWVTAGAKRVILHAGSVADAVAMEALVRQVRVEYPKSEPEAPVTFLELGVALHVDTPLEYIENFVDELDFVQCMGIEKVGFQQQPFSEKVLDQIQDLQAKYPDLVVSVDGGVSFDTATSLREAGATRLVSGSAIFESDDVASAIETLENL